MHVIKKRSENMSLSRKLQRSSRASAILINDKTLINTFNVFLGISVKIYKIIS